MANKKKVTTAAVAVAAAAALMLGGTFAWQSISQTALNEASDVINPGGRLHDDFNGENKDVYVENFADDPIYARIRLSEYFEIIANYQFLQDEDTSNNDLAVSTPILGSKNDDGTYNYELYKFDGNVAENGVVSAGKGTDGYAWWTWQTGGQTDYMPTFNMNKDSLAADINGIYEEGDIGTISDRILDMSDPEAQYSEYTEYTAGDTETGDEIYDADANDVEDDGITTIAGVEHTAKTTSNATLISMQEWIDAGSQSGPYWVYDTDGWVYWAQAIEPDTATGLLLDSIELNQVMDDTWYYAINVVAQFVTADDLGHRDEPKTGFFADPDNFPSENALRLLETIGVDVNGTNEVTYDAVLLDGQELEYVEAGKIYELSVETGIAAYSLRNAVTYTYTSDNTVATIEESTLAIDADAAAKTQFTITATGDDGSTVSTKFTVAEPLPQDDLQAMLNAGGDIDLEGTIVTGEEDVVIPNFDGSTTADYVWTEGGTVNGGALNSTSGSSHTLFINNENNWPVNGDGANAATMNGTNITSGSRFAIYAQAVDAPITLNDMNITNNHGGGILAEYTKPITLNNLTVYSASLDEDYAWVNSALAAGMGANVEISGGSYTGTNAIYLLSSGANVTIYGGTFNGALTVEQGTLTISGGKFTNDPSDYVAEGYEVTEEDGWYIVSETSGGGSESELAMTFSSSPEYKVGADGVPYIEIARNRTEDFKWNLWNCSEEGGFSLSSSNDSVTSEPYSEGDDSNTDMNVVIPTSVTEDFTVTATAMNGSGKSVTFTVKMVDNEPEGGDPDHVVPSYIEIWSSNTDIENTEPAATIAESEYWKDPANSGEYWFRIYDEEGNAINDAVISGDYYGTETTAITDFAATSEWQDDNFTAPYYSWLAQSATGGEIIVTIDGDDYYFGVEMEY